MHYFSYSYYYFETGDFIKALEKLLFNNEDSYPEKDWLLKKADELN